jgi:hypothetical protein
VRYLTQPRASKTPATTSLVISRLVILALLTSTVFGAEHNPKIAVELEGHSPGTPLRVLVQYKHVPEARNIAAAVGKGARYERTLKVVNAVAYTVPAKALVELAKDPDVQRIMPDRDVAANANSTRELNDHRPGTAAVMVIGEE